MALVEEMRSAFRALHASGCFVLPNPWNIGTGIYLQSLGFKALATTSSGYAHSLGLPDGPGGVTRDQALAHFSEMASCIELPLNADFQNGYADDPESVAENVKRCVATGVAGISIEDATGDESEPLYELPLAVERIRAARKAIDQSAPGVLLTARAECYVVGHQDPFPESVKRLQAYADAGADVLYAPGVRASEHIRHLVAAVAPKPVNVLMGFDVGLRVADLAQLGVRRISVGGALAKVAWAAFANAAQQIAHEGSFTAFKNLDLGFNLNDLFRNSRD